MRSSICYTYFILYLFDIVVAVNATNINDYALGTVESYELNTHCIYQINLTKIPISATRQDFSVDTFALNFLQITAKIANITWKVKLLKVLIHLCRIYHLTKLFI